MPISLVIMPSIALSTDSYVLEPILSVTFSKPLNPAAKAFSPIDSSVFSHSSPRFL
jgi:hypothetical protein